MCVNHDTYITVHGYVRICTPCSSIYRDSGAGWADRAVRGLARGLAGLALGVDPVRLRHVFLGVVRDLAASSAATVTVTVTATGTVAPARGAVAKTVSPGRFSDLVYVDEVELAGGGGRRVEPKRRR